MPKVTHVKKAQKDNPVVKAGQSYYWWKFRFGGKRFSTTYPKPSQLTQSSYLTVILGCQERWQEMNEPGDIVAADWDQGYIVTWLGEIADVMEGIKDELLELVDQYEEGATNIEEYFSGSEKIDQMRECGSECEQTCDEIDMTMDEVRGTADEIETLEMPDKEDFEDEDEWQAQCDSDIQDLVDALSFSEPNFDFHDL